MTRNQIMYQQNVETKRSNLANELESNRHNVATETETNRSNVAREQETNRSNLAKELETNRHNLATEGIGRRQISLGYDQLAETQRANQAREVETARSNLAKEIETNRHNVVSEDETSRSNKAKESNENTRTLFDYELRRLGFNTQREVAEINAASNMAVQQLKEEGLDSRQAKQLVSDNIQYYVGEILDLFKNEESSSTIRNALFKMMLRRQTR